MLHGSVGKFSGQGYLLFLLRLTTSARTAGLLITMPRKTLRTRRFDGTGWIGDDSLIRSIVPLLLYFPNRLPMSTKANSRIG